MSTTCRLARAPAALISAATFSPADASMSRMATAQPSSPSRRAIAAPIPFAPPVMMTARFFNPRMSAPRLCPALARARQHAGGLIGHHHLVALVLHVDLGYDDAPIVLGGRPHRRHLDFAMQGVADTHRRQHPLPELEHRQPGALDHALAEQAL